MVRNVWEVVMAGIGTMAFALLFHVPRRFYFLCGCIGSAGWVVYRIAELYMSIPLATFLGVLLVVLLARISAAYMRCPVTVFLIAGIFPLVPGAGIYWTAYYIVMNQMTEAGERGLLTLQIAIAIVFGILVVFEIPQEFFHAFTKKNIREIGK